MCLRVPKDDPVVFVDHRPPRRVKRESISYRRNSRPVSRVSETVISQHRQSTASIPYAPPSPKPATPTLRSAPVPAAAPPVVVPSAPAPVPASPSPIISRPLTPPRVPTPPESRLELVKVEEEWAGTGSGTNQSASHISRRKSRKGSRRGSVGSRDRDEVYEYIQRDRIIELGTPPPPSTRRGSRDIAGDGGYRYVEGVGRGTGMTGTREREEDHGSRHGPGYGHGYSGESDGRRRSRSITYATDSPRSSGRLVERERVVIEDGGRRTEFYRRA